MSLCRDGGLLIGVDLQKDRRVLEAAYNDSAGVTAQFNLNLLERVNRELGADFDLDQWRHRAIYNSNAGRIEMYLISEIDQIVHIDDRKFHFRRRRKNHYRVFLQIHAGRVCRSSPAKPDSSSARCGLMTRACLAFSISRCSGDR